MRGRLPAASAAMLVVAVLTSGVAHAASAGAPVGNVEPALAPVTGVAAAATSAAVDDRVAVLIQNAGTRAVRVDLVTATATTAEGGAVTRARSVESFPQVVAPGELALASVQFRRNGVPPGATVVVKVRSTPVKAARASRALAVSGPVLSAPQTGPVAQTLDATLANGTTNWSARDTKVAVMCFGESREPSTITTARPKPPVIAPGKQGAIRVPLTTLCPTYLVAARAS